jgi:hypothetical protein
MCAQNADIFACGGIQAEVEGIRGLLVLVDDKLHPMIRNRNALSYTLRRIGGITVDDDEFQIEIRRILT